VARHRVVLGEHDAGLPGRCGTVRKPWWQFWTDWLGVTTRQLVLIRHAKAWQVFAGSLAG
jgi:hypothetical protein